MKKIFLILLVVALSAPVFAEGYQVNVLSAKQTGMGHVGTGMKLGAESMHFNPAGLAFMKNTIDLSIGVSGVSAKASYKDGDYSAKTDNPLSTPMYAYAGFKIYHNFSAGISLTTPYGSALKWPKNWKGAHLIQDIELKSFVLQPTFSYKITDRFSVGAGLMLATGNVQLSRALMPVGALVPLLGAAFKDVVPASATLDGKANIRAGYNIGFMYDLCDKVTIGASYRSKIKMKVKEGTAQIDFASEQIKQAIASELPPLEEGTFTSELPLPSNTNLGVSYRPCNRWELALDLQYVGWNAYDSLNVYFTENVLNGYSIKAEKNYKNTIVARVGAQYQATERLDVRAGLYFDQSPIRKDNYNPETPGMNKVGLSTGLSFEPYKGLQIDFAFLYIQGIGRDGSYTQKNILTGQEEIFAGHYKSSAITASLGIAYRF